MSSTSKFYFRPGEGYQIETVVHIKPDTRSSIWGSVMDTGDRPVQDALVLLFETGADSDDLELISQGFTDDQGQFAFGPLVPDKLYLIKVHKDSVKLRELET